MKVHVIFNIFIQIFIFLVSVSVLYPKASFIYSLFLVMSIFIPTIYEFSTGQLLNKKIHYLFPITILFIFLILLII